MRNHFSKLALAAGVSLAMTFTFSCSSGGDDGGSSSPSGGGGSSPNVGNVSSSSNDNRDNSSSSSIKSISPSSNSTGDGGTEYIGGSCNASDYGAVTIGEQVWMAKNWGCYASGSKCYGESGKVYNEETGKRDITLSNSEIQANCNKYGRLYNWSTAMALPDSCNSSSCASQVNAKHRGICPSGWHIPSNEEWIVLLSFIYYKYTNCNCAGKHLKAASGWNDYEGKSGNGEDTYGFAALPGRYGYSDDNFYRDSSFYSTDDYGYWWSATDCTSSYKSSEAYSWIMSYRNENVVRLDNKKGYLLSVRCLQD